MARHFLGIHLTMGWRKIGMETAKAALTQSAPDSLFAWLRN